MSVMQHEPPLLPWEVIERIIGHTGDHLRTLRSLSLSCRQLHPRAFCLMIVGVRLASRNRTFDFYDFLRAKPHLQPLVQSIVVNPTDFAPVPLLRILPNVSEVGFTSPSQECIRALHQSTLTCFTLFGTHIQTLHLSHLFFDTYLQFSRVLLAFTNLVHLICTKVGVKREENQGHLALLRQRLSKRLRLKMLVIDAASATGRRDPYVSIDRLLFNSDLAPESTVESLRLIGLRSPNVDLWDKPDPWDVSDWLKSDSRDNSDFRAWSHLQSLLLKRPEWSRLRSLVLLISYLPEYIISAVTFLEDFHGPVLTEVVVELHTTASIMELVRPLLSACGHADESGQEINQQLERALLRFPPPRIVWIIKELRSNRQWFWNDVLGKQFPVISKRGGLMVKAETVLRAGHDTHRWICSLVIAPNGVWVASGSDDSTIILWDVKGNIVRQWVAHNHMPVRSLVFSQDSRYLVSGGEDSKMVLWDLGQDACNITLDLAANAETIAWSPDGNVIAIGSWDGAVRLLDAHTFQQLHVLLEEWEANMAHCVTFSPDGRWLVVGLSACNYCIYDVQAGGLHTFISGQVPILEEIGSGPITSISAAFDLESTRLAHASGSDAVEIWDIETRSRLSLLRYAALVNDVSFSPDGRLVLAALMNGTVSVCDAYAADEVFLLKGHRSRVAKACFSPCGKYIASASWDRTVKLWKTSDGSLVATFCEHDDGVEHLVFSADGKTLASGGLNGAVVIRDMDDVVTL